MSTSAVVVHLPAQGPLAAASGVRCRVGREGVWGRPGEALAAEPGPTTVSIHARLATPALHVDAELELPVDVAAGGVTELRLASLSRRARR